MDTRVRRQYTMNPATLLRLWKAFENPRTWEVHVLRIGAESGCWPQTVYKAVQLGYLIRTRPAWFTPSSTMQAEVTRAQAILRERQRMRVAS